MKFLILIAAILGFNVVQAAEVESTTIKRMMFDESYGDIVYIALNDRQPNPISCHTNGSWEYVLDTSTSLGQKMYSSLLAAYVSKSDVKFVGKNDCNLSPQQSIETLRRIELK